MLIAEFFVGLASAGLIGALLLSLFALSSEKPEFGRALTVGAASAGVLTVAAGVVTIVAHLDHNALDPAWLTTTIAAALLTVLCFAFRSQGALVVVALIAVGSLVPLALRAGAVADAIAHTDRDLVAAAVGLQLVGAAAGVGAPLTLGLIGGTLGRERRRVIAARCAGIATFCAVVVAFGALLTAGLDLGGRAGLATALTREPTPASDVATNTPAEILTGRPLPPPETLARLVTGANLDAIWLLACAFGLFFYLAGVRRLRRRGETWPAARAISWVVGVLVLAYATSGGLAIYADYLFSAQVAAHLAIAIVVPLLLTPAAPVALALRTIDARTDASRGAREWLVLVVRSRAARFLVRPVVSGVVFSGSLWAFYYSSALRWAVANPIGRELATAYFLAVGCVFVRSMLGRGADAHPDAHPDAAAATRRSSWRLRLVVVLAVMVLQAAFGAVVMMSSGLFFADWFGAMGRTWGALPLADQRTAGLIALSVGEIALAVLAIAVTVRPGRRAVEAVCTASST